MILCFPILLFLPLSFCTMLNKIIPNFKNLEWITLPPRKTGNHVMRLCSGCLQYANLLKSCNFKKTERNTLEKLPWFCCFVILSRQKSCGYSLNEFSEEWEVNIYIQYFFLALKSFFFSPCMKKRLCVIAQH